MSAPVDTAEDLIRWAAHIGALVAADSERMATERDKRIGPDDLVLIEASARNGAIEAFRLVMGIPLGMSAFSRLGQPPS